MTRPLPRWYLTTSSRTFLQKMRAVRSSNADVNSSSTQFVPPPSLIHFAKITAQKAMCRSPLDNESWARLYQSPCPLSVLKHKLSSTSLASNGARRLRTACSAVSVGAGLHEICVPEPRKRDTVMDLPLPLGPISAPSRRVNSVELNFLGSSEKNSARQDPVDGWSKHFCTCCVVVVVWTEISTYTFFITASSSALGPRTSVRPARATCS
mmetsp:Transcript_24568/g.62546  ORF Transcript_24568/g.62546 Transcript_24568/m.62546 type:complete len:210 (+) Transcript_24568:1653-2282(+)